MCEAVGTFGKYKARPGLLIVTTIDKLHSQGVANTLKCLFCLFSISRISTERVNCEMMGSQLYGFIARPMTYKTKKRKQGKAKEESMKQVDTFNSITSGKQPVVPT